MGLFAVWFVNSLFAIKFACYVYTFNLLVTRKVIMIHCRIGSLLVSVYARLVGFLFVGYSLSQ